MAAAKNIKTEEDLNEFRQMLTRITVEAALNAELDEHYVKVQLSEGRLNKELRAVKRQLNFMKYG